MSPASPETGPEAPVAPRPLCSAVSTDLAEPVLGTASVVRTWLLLEHAGPWSSTALASTRLHSGLGTELARRANHNRVRVVLIRRPGRTLAGGPPACFAATTGLAGSWLGRATLDQPADVLDLDLAALASGDRSAFTTTHEPLLCVCTHGSHDRCCAERGRPVAAALAARFPQQTWEVSHIGGDRFAGNVAVFPDGDYLGRLDAASAVPVVEDYLDGRYALEHLRGRAGIPPLVQAAEILVRQRLAVVERDAVRVRAADLTRGRVRVRLDVTGHGTVRATVRATGAEPERALTCASERAVRPPTYTLEAIAVTPLVTPPDRRPPARPEQ